MLSNYLVTIIHYCSLSFCLLWLGLSLLILLLTFVVKSDGALFFDVICTSWLNMSRIQDIVRLWLGKLAKTAMTIGLTIFPFDYGLAEPVCLPRPPWLPLLSNFLPARANVTSLRSYIYTVYCSLTLSSYITFPCKSEPWCIRPLGPFRQTERYRLFLRSYSTRCSTVCTVVQQLQCSCSTSFFRAMYNKGRLLFLSATRLHKSPSRTTTWRACVDEIKMTLLNLRRTSRMAEKMFLHAAVALWNVPSFISSSCQTHLQLLVCHFAFHSGDCPFY